LKYVLEECPKDINKNNNLTHVRKIQSKKSQCLINWNEEDKYKFALRNIFNEKKDEIIFFYLNNEINITNLTLLKNPDNVQAKELWKLGESRWISI